MGKVRNLNAEQIETIRNLYLDGEKVEYIAGLYGLKVGTINRLVRESGLPHRNRHWSIEDKRSFLHDVKMLSNRQVAEKYGMTTTYVCVCKAMFHKQVKNYDNKRKNLRPATK